MEDDEENPGLPSTSETTRLLLPGEKAPPSSRSKQGASSDSKRQADTTVEISRSHSQPDEEAGATSRSSSTVRKIAASPMSMSRSQQLQQKKSSFGDADDLEAGSEDQPQCRICLESDGRDFIAPCRCKGSAKFVHRECLDQWRSVKEGLAFAHCTTCKMPYHIRVHAPLDARWRTAKFRFFVTRDALAVTLMVQTLICLFGYLVYAIDYNLAASKLKLACGFKSSFAFYYLCVVVFLDYGFGSQPFPLKDSRFFLHLSRLVRRAGLLIFFFMAGILGCVFTCIDRRFRTDIGGPCRELCACCCNPLVWGDCHCCSPLCLYTDCSVCADCAGASSECLTAGGLGEAGAMFFVTIGTIALVVFAVVGIFYSLVVAAVVAQRIWQRHYHILAKRMLTKEYVVEDLAGQDLTGNWSPPPLPPEHEKQLRELGLMG